MALSNSLQQRVLEPEVMDDPDLDESKHVHALRGLARLNFWSWTTRLVWPAIHRIAKGNGERPLRILDVASGGGDTPLRLWRRSQRKGVPLEIVGIDISPQAVGYAQSRAQAIGAPVSFMQHDALAEDLPSGFDVITSSLFLHHLDEQDATALLRKMSVAARQLVLVQDLRRNTSGLWLAYLASRAFTRSKVVHADATQSVRASFTLNEFRQLADSAGLTGAQVVARWPCRLVLSWQKTIPQSEDTCQ